MNSEEIEKYFLFLLKKTKIKAAFVLAKDELPFVKISKFPTGLIVNTDDRKYPGQHWTAFFKQKKIISLIVIIIPIKNTTLSHHLKFILVIQKFYKLLIR